MQTGQACDMLVKINVIAKHTVVILHKNIQANMYISTEKTLGKLCIIFSEKSCHIIFF